MKATSTLFQNVLGSNSFINNIANAAGAAGWTIDSNTQTELYLHSTGEFGNQSLYYSMVVGETTDAVPGDRKKYLMVYGNTNYNAALTVNQQPGRWSASSLNHDRGGLSTTWWKRFSSYANSGVSICGIPSSIDKQYVLACSQYIIVMYKVVYTAYSGASIDSGYTQSGWNGFVIGAGDSSSPNTATDGNLLLGSYYGVRNAIGGMLTPVLTFGTTTTEQYNDNTIGFAGVLSNGVERIVAPSVNPSYPFSSLADATKSVISTTPIVENYNYTTSPAYRYSMYDALTARYTYSLILHGDQFLSYWGAIKHNVATSMSTMIKPVLMNYEKDGEDTYYYPSDVSLPYYACPMVPYNAPEDVVSVGSKKFILFPLWGDDSEYGIAVEIN